MQTFLPYPSFAESARCLDNKRLGKQRVEAKQIYLALTDASYGWQNHPAVRMWRGYHITLAAYGEAICAEWVWRGFNDSLRLFFINLVVEGDLSSGAGMSPPWLGDPTFHASHRSNLLRKDPVHYSRFGWTEPPDLPYIWPDPATPVPSFLK